MALIAKRLAPPVLINFLALDETHGWVYFSVALNQASNVPFLIYRCQLKSQTPELLAKEPYTSGVAMGQVSPDGRYLAYTTGWHASACDSGTTANVIDLKEKRRLEVPFGKKKIGKDKLISATSFKWLNQDGLEVKEAIYEVLPAVKTQFSAVQDRAFLAIDVPSRDLFSACCM